MFRPQILASSFTPLSFSHPLSAQSCWLRFQNMSKIQPLLTFVQATIANWSLPWWVITHYQNNESFSCPAPLIMGFKRITWQLTLMGQHPYSSYKVLWALMPSSLTLQPKFLMFLIFPSYSLCWGTQAFLLFLVYSKEWAKTCHND